MASQNPKVAAAEPSRKAPDTPSPSPAAHPPANKPAPLSGSLQNPTAPPDASSAPQQLEVPAVAADSGSNSGLASAPEAEPVTDLQKKLRRAERFGTPVMLSEEEKRNSRAERFGTGLPTMSGNKNVGQLEEQKRKARAERFGLTTNSVADEEAKKKARLERFAPNSKIDSTEEEKRKARAIRFSQGSPKVNGQANSDMKATTVANT